MDKLQEMRDELEQLREKNKAGELTYKVNLKAFDPEHLPLTKDQEDKLPDPAIYSPRNHNPIELKKLKKNPLSLKERMRRALFKYTLMKISDNPMQDLDEMMKTPQ